jgi:hypothetical protein
MATRDDVYREFGKTVELAQLLETELGTLLLAQEAIQHDAFTLDVWESGAQVVKAIEKRTLGQSLGEIRKRYHISDDLESVFDQALAARNRLAHGFYLSYGRRIETDRGCDEMIAHLFRLQKDLWPAYQIAGALAQHLMDEFSRLHRQHRSQS